VINLPHIDQVPSNRLLGILYQEEVAYCYQSVNAITLGLAQSDPIKRLPLYLIFFKILAKLALAKLGHEWPMLLNYASIVQSLNENDYIFVVRAFFLHSIYVTH
jgi:hypothetical protein